VPFTLQVFAVLASGAVLGARRGVLSQVVYLLLGASGLPVFARFHGGAAVLAGPTAGYLWAYPLAAALAGWGWGRAARIPGAGVRGAGLAGWLGLAAGLACIYALGVAGLVATRTVPDAARALRAGVYPFVLFDAAKAALAGVVAQRVRAAVPALESPESSGGGDER
jgi:biotin transport system substrate-specific component